MACQGPPWALERQKAGGSHLFEECLCVWELGSQSGVKFQDHPRMQEGWVAKATPFPRAWSGQWSLVAALNLLVTSLHLDAFPEHKPKFPTLIGNFSAFLGLKVGEIYILSSDPLDLELS